MPTHIPGAVSRPAVLILGVGTVILLLLVLLFFTLSPYLRTEVSWSPTPFTTFAVGEEASGDGQENQGACYLRRATGTTCSITRTAMECGEPTDRTVLRSLWRIGEQCPPARTLFQLAEGSVTVAAGVASADATRTACLQDLFRDSGLTCGPGTELRLYSGASLSTKDARPGFVEVRCVGVAACLPAAPAPAPPPTTP